MAENRGPNIVGGILAFIIIAAFVHSCDDSPGYSSNSYSSTPATDSDGELKEAVDEFETARQKLAAVAFDERQKAQYVTVVDAELARMDYDFDGIFGWETKSRTRFRNMLLDACQSRGVAPPEYLSQMGGPFDKSEASIDWGSSSDSSQLPESVRRWIDKQSATADPLRQELARLSAKQIVASKILALASLREELQGKLREAQTLLRKFKSDINKIEQNVRTGRAEKNIATASAAMSIPAIRNDLETLRSKRAYVRYLTTFISVLEGAITDL